MICIPIRKKTMSSLLKHISEANKLADVIEIWFDEIPNLTDEKIEGILKATKKPILYKHTGNKESLRKLLPKKLAYIDLDFKESPKLIKEVKQSSPESKLIISFHDFEKTPTTAELTKMVAKMQKLGADLVKIAATANSLSDSMRMLSFLSQLKEKGQKAICLCMGKEGKITRITGHLLGNYLMYAAITERDKTASGQLLAKELKEIQKLALR